jgi:hypothetical protein
MSLRIQNNQLFVQPALIKNHTFRLRGIQETVNPEGNGQKNKRDNIQQGFKEEREKPTF